MSINSKFYLLLYIIQQLLYGLAVYSNCCMCHNNTAIVVLEEAAVVANKLKLLIENKKANFLRKFKYACLNELEYWEMRPENFSKEIFERYVVSIDETKVLYPTMSERESSNGKYGETGFGWVFKFEDEFKVMGRLIKVYVKGFFFEVDEPRGVEIQSFKKSTRLKIVSEKDS